MDFYPAPLDRLETPKASPTYQDQGPPTRTVPVVASPPRHPELSQGYTDTLEDTGQERIPIETMPVDTMRHSTSQSGVAKINIGSRSSYNSSSEEDSTEDEVEYLGTRKPDSSVDESYTTLEAEKPSTLVKQEKHQGPLDVWDEEGFTQVLTRHN